MLFQNPRYKDLNLELGTYVPHMRDDYPSEDPYVRLYQPQYVRSLKFDENYPYIDDSRRGRFLRWFGHYFVLHIPVWFLLRFQMGLHVVGRRWLEDYVEELSNGAITISNHCHRHDCEAIMLAVKRYLPNTRIPMFAPNFNTKDKTLMEMIGGVPIPPAEMGIQAMKKFNEAFDEYARRRYWFHIFPEACKWDWYLPLRPFQKGAFTMAYKYELPIVPCMISWRPRTGIYRLFGPKNMPLMTVTIGKPILPNNSEPRKTEVARMIHVAHTRMCRMGGIQHNTWPESM